MNTLKKALTAIALLTFSCLLSPEAKCWGNLGHATVAKIAQGFLPFPRNLVLGGAPHALHGDQMRFLEFA